MKTHNRNQNNIKSGTQLEKCRAIGSHAESNAICLAAKDGTACDKSTIYIFGHVSICPQCRAMIANSGILRAVITHPDGTREDYDVTGWKVHPLDKEN